MNHYRHLWVAAFRSMAVVGGCLAVITFPLSSTMTLLCTGAGVGAVISHDTNPAESAASHRHGPHHRVVAHAASTGIAFLAVAGFGVVLGAWLWPLVLVFVVMSPLVLKVILRQGPLLLPQAPLTSESAVLAGVPVEAAVFAPSLRVLDDHDLCQAWSRSYGWLEVASSLQLRAYIVALRQAYLDEVDRRDPVGLQTWLDSCPRPRRGPERFLHRGTGDHHLPA